MDDRRLTGVRAAVHWYASMSCIMPKAGRGALDVYGPMVGMNFTHYATSGFGQDGLRLDAGISMGGC